MSLNKTIQTPSGYDANYWRISEVRLNTEEKQMRIDIRGYKDKAAFEAGAAAVTPNRIHVSLDEIAELSVLGVADCFKSFLGKCEQIAVETNEEFDSAVVDEEDTL